MDTRQSIAAPTVRRYSDARDVMREAVIRLHRFELHHKAIGQFAHPSDKIAIHIRHP
jgi:hypothetical protein